MSTNKTFLWIAASMLTGAFCAASALASPMQPADSYVRITAVEGERAPLTPALSRGFSDLAGNERRFQERLPVQLSGPVKKVKGSKYKKSSKPSKKHFKKSKSRKA